MIPFQPIDCAFNQQIQKKSLTEVTGDTEEKRCGSSVSSVTSVRAISVFETDECIIEWRNRCEMQRLIRLAPDVYPPGKRVRDVAMQFRAEPCR